MALARSPSRGSSLEASSPRCMAVLCLLVCNVCCGPMKCCCLVGVFEVQQGKLPPSHELLKCMLPSCASHLLSGGADRRSGVRILQSQVRAQWAAVSEEIRYTQTWCNSRKKHRHRTLKKVRRWLDLRQKNGR